jgi:hypothetical protein
MSQRSMSRGAVDDRAHGSVHTTGNRWSERSPARWLWRTALLGTLLLWSAVASAAKPSIGVLVDGPGAEGVRGDIVAAVPSGFDVVDRSTLASALVQHHVSMKAVRSGQHSQAFVGNVRKASIAIGADAVVLVKARVRKGKPTGEYVVVAVAASRDDAAIDDNATIESDGDHSSQWKRTLAPLFDLLQGGSKAAAAPTENTEKAEKATPEGTSPKENDEGTKAVAAEAAPEPAAESKSASGPVSITDSLLTGFLGLDLGGRQFHYNDRVTDSNLRPYDLPQGVLLPETPGLAASVEVYPLARTEWSYARDIGLSGHVGIDWAKARLGTSTTSVQWHSWEVNLRGRIPLGPRASSTFIGVELGAGELDFGFDAAASSVTARLPGVDYHYLRLGVDGRIPAGPVAVLLGLAYRPILGAGQLGTDFPHESIAGMDAKVGVALKLLPWMEARIVVNYTRVWASFNPHLGDTYVAGGGLDQFVNADFGVAAFF